MEKKLAAKLWKLSRDYGVPYEQGVLINFPITITSLADFLGSYRETISRALKILINNELVIYKYENIYFVEFIYNNVNYDIETDGINIVELEMFLKSIIK